MSDFSFNEALMTSLDAVRSNIGDTRANEVILTDSRIAAVLARYSGDVYLASAECCLLAAAKYARDVTVSGGQVGSSQRKEKVDRYMELHKHYRLLAGESAECFVGGGYQTDNDTLDQDQSVRHPVFAVGEDDLPIVGNNDPNSWPN